MPQFYAPAEDKVVFTRRVDAGCDRISRKVPHSTTRRAAGARSRDRT